MSNDPINTLILTITGHRFLTPQSWLNPDMERTIEGTNGEFNKFHLGDERWMEVFTKTKQVLRRAQHLYEQVVVVDGMALGFDQLVIQAVTEVNNEIEEGNLIMVLGAVPCRNQESRWRDNSKLQYGKMLDAIDAWVHVPAVINGQEWFDELNDAGMYVNGKTTSTCYVERDKWMVDFNDLSLLGLENHTIVKHNVLAMWDGRGGKSGTWHTVRYADGLGKTIMIINPNNGKLTKPEDWPRILDNRKIGKAKGAFYTCDTDILKTNQSALIIPIAVVQKPQDEMYLELLTRAGEKGKMIASFIKESVKSKELTLGGTVCCTDTKTKLIFIGVRKNNAAEVDQKHLANAYRELWVNNCYNLDKLAMPDIGEGEFLAKVGRACAEKKGMTVVLYTKPVESAEVPY